MHHTSYASPLSQLLFSFTLALLNPNATLPKSCGPHHASTPWPHLLPSHRPAHTQALLDAGATLRGKTHMDELAYSLNGENVHYGTPGNPAAPGRIPGGSSSGSAVSCLDTKAR